LNRNAHPQISSITESLKEHYTKTFAQYGATPKGVDWGVEASDLNLRYDNMLAVINRETSKPGPLIRLLDVGCGYGGLKRYADEHRYRMDYVGVDVCRAMISEARLLHPDSEFYSEDFFAFNPARKFDYVVCNGILTQKLEASVMQMDLFAQQLIKKMFGLAEVGVAFNVMTTHVNYMAPNLYYRNPVELMGWCFSEITPHLKLNHAYRLFEYTMYLYRSREQAA